MKEKWKIIRHYLEGERKRLRNELALQTGQHHHKELKDSDNIIKKEDAAAACFEMEKRYAQIKAIKEQLTDIEHALHKLDEGTYGLCDQCHNPIPPTRLEALPQTSCCINCKVRVSELSA